MSLNNLTINHFLLENEGVVWKKQEIWNSGFPVHFGAYVSSCVFRIKQQITALFNKSLSCLSGLKNICISTEKSMIK
jgi:hypothetical protein